MSVKGLLTVIFGPEDAQLIMPEGPAGPMDIIKQLMGPQAAPPSGLLPAPPAPQLSGPPMMGGPPAGPPMGGLPAPPPMGGQ